MFQACYLYLHNISMLNSSYMEKGVFDILRPHSLEWLFSFLVDLGILATITLIFITALIVFLPPYIYYNSKAKSKHALSNWLVALIVLVTILLSNEIRCNWNHLSDQINITRFEGYLCLTIIAIGIGGFFSLTSFLIFLFNNLSYDLNKKLVDYNKKKSVTENNQELEESIAKTHFLKNLKDDLENRKIFQSHKDKLQDIK